MPDQWQSTSDHLPATGSPVATGGLPNASAPDAGGWQSTADHVEPPSLDWSKVVRNLPGSLVNFAKSVSQGLGPTGPNWSPEQIKYFQDAAAAEKAGKPLPDAPVPNGRFSQAHPDVAQNHPMVASAADSLEDLVHNVTNPREFFEKDPVGAAQTFGNLAAGGFKGLVSAVPAVGDVAETAATAAKGAASGAVEGATTPTKLPRIYVGPARMQIEAPVPASVTGGVTGGLIGHHFGGAPGAVAGAVIGGGAPIIKGAWEGAQSALADLAAKRAIAAKAVVEAQQAAQDVADAVKTPLANRQLPAAPTVIPAGPVGAPVDTSGPIPTDPTTGRPLSMGPAPSPEIAARSAQQPLPVERQLPSASRAPITAGPIEARADIASPPAPTIADSSTADRPFTPIPTDQVTGRPIASTPTTVAPTSSAAQTLEQQAGLTAPPRVESLQAIIDGQKASGFINKTDYSKLDPKEQAWVRSIYEHVNADPTDTTPLGERGAQQSPVEYLTPAEKAAKAAQEEPENTATPAPAPASTSPEELAAPASATTEVSRATVSDQTETPNTAPESAAVPTPTSRVVEAPARGEIGPSKLMSEEGLAKYAQDNGIAEDDARQALTGEGYQILGRSALNRALHGIGGELDLDHDMLSDAAKIQFRVKSMSQLSQEQMLELYQNLQEKRALNNPMLGKGELAERFSGQQTQPKTSYTSQPQVGPPASTSAPQRPLSGFDELNQQLEASLRARAPQAVAPAQALKTAIESPADPTSTTQSQGVVPEPIAENQKKPTDIARTPPSQPAKAGSGGPDPKFIRSTLEGMAQRLASQKPGTPEYESVLNDIDELRSDTNLKTPDNYQYANDLFQNGWVRHNNATAATAKLTASAKGKPAPSPVETPAESVGFGKETTQNGKKQFSAIGTDVNGASTDRVTVSQDRVDNSRWIVEHQRYEVPPGQQNPYGRTKTEQIGQSYSKAEARSVAESYLKGQPNPFAEMEAGQPISAYKPGSGKLSLSDSTYAEKDGFPHNTINGQEFWTDGHVAFPVEGKTPVSDTGSQPDIERTANIAIKEATNTVKPIGTYRSGPGPSQIVFSDGTVISSKFYDYALKRFKDAEFKSAGPKSALVVNSGGKFVGMIMPMRPDVLPANITKLIKVGK